MLQHTNTDYADFLGNMAKLGKQGKLTVFMLSQCEMPTGRKSVGQELVPSIVIYTRIACSIAAKSPALSCIFTSFAAAAVAAVDLVQTHSFTTSKHG